jgi:transposase
MESELKPMHKVANMLRSHKELILNWYSVPGGLSSGPVEELNNKAKLIIRKAYGFKTVLSQKCLNTKNENTLGELRLRSH